MFEIEELTWLNYKMNWHVICIDFPDIKNKIAVTNYRDNQYKRAMISDWRVSLSLGSKIKKNYQQTTICSG